MLWRIPATLPQQQLFLAEVIREVQFVVCLNTGDDSQLHYISLAKSLSGPHQEPRAKIVQNM